MAIISVNVRLPWAITATSIPTGPVSSNTYHFDTGSTTPSEANTANIADALISLYGTELDGTWSSILDGAILVSAINMADATPRTAYGIWSGTLSPNATSLPGEVSMKAQIRATPASGIPPQRFRGTLQLGPLSPEVLNDGGNISETAMGAYEAAFTDFAAAIALTPFTWVVGTETSGYQPVTRVRIVNECGTVRRRQFGLSDRRDITV